MDIIGAMKKSFEEIRQEAEQGNAEAQFILGLMYHEGEGVAEDKSEAARWFRAAAEQRHAEAQSYLGWMYYEGKGVVQDEINAANWWRAAAEQGDAKASFNLRLMRKRGVREDKSEAVRWLRTEANQGNAEAQFTLGSRYYNGEGVTEDKSEAAIWFRKAAEQGYAEAQTNLGVMYRKGEGVVKDESEAVRWFRAAAEQGYAEAQYNLGRAYYIGEGVVKDVREAYILFLITKAGGLKEADKALSLASEELNSAEKQSAESEATRRCEKSPAEAGWQKVPETAEKIAVKKYQMLVDGEWVDSSDSGVVESVNPSTGIVWATWPEATAPDVDKAVRAAAAAFPGWAAQTPTARGHALRRLAGLIEAQGETLGRTESTDTGKLLRETKWQAKYLAEFFYFYAGCADKICGETLPIDKPDIFAFTVREPLGVVAAVVPWNSQLFLSAVKIGPALAAGNTIVLKASEHAAAAMLEFGRLIEQAGIPPGVVNILTGRGEPCGRALTSHPLVARVSFTGGAAAARHVVRNTAENFAELSLELGGKSPVIVFADADMESAINGALGAIFGASGQSCVAGSRLYVQDSIADEFLSRMAQRADAIRIGDPLDDNTDMGPLCTAAQLETIEREVKLALADGGKLLCGGARPPNLAGLFYRPTIIDCPRQDMQIVNTELFGPVLSALRFTDEAEALALANDTTYGLAAGIFTRDNARALRLSKAINAGIIWVNTYRAISPIAEFGGGKNSGYGRESGFQAMYDYTRPKTVWLNHSDEPLTDPFVIR